MKKTSQLFSFACILLIIVVPILVLFGWITDNTTLTRIFPKFTPMNPVTAVCFLFVGIYILIERWNTSRFQKYVLLGISIIPTLVGLVMIGKYVWGIDILIDRVLFESKLGINRMAPTTSVNFFLVGISLLMYSRFSWILQLMQIGVASISVYALAAYLYNFVGVYGDTIFNPMALHTATLFLLISVYLIVHKGTTGIFALGIWKIIGSWFESLSIKYKFIFGFGAIFIIACCFFWYSFSSFTKLLNLHKEQEKIFFATSAALELDIDVLRSIITTDQYIDTKDPALLEKIYQNRELVKLHTAQLKQEATNQSVVDLISKYESGRPERLLITDQILAKIQAGDDPSSFAELKHQRNINNEIIRGYLKDIISLEQKYLQESLSFSQKQARIIEVNLIFITIVILFVIVFISVFILTSITSSIYKLMVFAKKIEEGNYNVRLGIMTKDETGKLAQIMDKMAKSLHVRTTQLLRVNAKDEAMLGSIGEGMVGTDAKGVITVVNKAAQTMLGLSESEMLGKKWAVEIPTVEDEKGEKIKSDQTAIATALKGKKVVRTSYYYKTLENKRFPVVVTASPVVINSKVVGGIVVFRDITEEKKIDQAKTEFVSLASHQLRTPLTSINWYAELMKDKTAGPLTTDQELYIKEIADASNRMVDLVNSLLNVSRLELGTFVVEPEEIDPLSVITSAVHEQEVTFKNKKQKFTFTHPDVLPLIKIDKRITFMIVQNLLSNAGKYTPDGGTIELHVGVVGTGKKGYLSIECKDSGYGIPKALQKNIFQKLYRADNIRTKDVEGTGLGLYIVKTVADTAGCSISFTSEENQGTTFMFKIPLVGMTPKAGGHLVASTTRKHDII